MRIQSSKVILSIFIFLVQLVMGYVLYLMFENLRDGVQVSREDISLFNIFLVLFAVISLVLCIWCLRMRTHSIVKLFSVLAAVGTILLAFNLRYKSLNWPSQIRLQLINQSGKPVKDFRLSGCMDLNIDSVGINDSRTYELPVTEGCAVWLVNKNDSVKIVETSSNGIGYRKDYTFR